LKTSLYQHHLAWDLSSISVEAKSNIGRVGISEVGGSHSMMSLVNSSIRISISISSIGESWGSSIGVNWGSSIGYSWGSIMASVGRVEECRISFRLSLSFALLDSMYNWSTLGNIIGNTKSSTQMSGTGCVDLRIVVVCDHLGWGCHHRLDKGG